MSRLFKAIGLMSGTSLDGVDGALLTTDGEMVAEPGLALTFPYGAETRAKLHAALVAARSLTRGLPVPPEIDAAERVLTEAHVDLVAHLLAQAQLEPSDVDYIGFHGQTVLHRPEKKLTVQIGDAPALAKLIHVPVMYDFRAADVDAVERSPAHETDHFEEPGHRVKQPLFRGWFQRRTSKVSRR